MPNKLTAALSVPSHEAQVIESTASKYKLNPEQKKLLYTIRKVENGSAGREFGVLHPQAMRYASNPEMSFKTQAAWAAGSIRDHYTGDLKAFASRWAPVNASNDPKGLNNNWHKNAKYYMDNMS